ncbi:hypothetical protein F4818DRAFT_111186 [Hypoxylon cercidicola]|nr:hypothetical protein F4818DRAFT_111186 [Hypoxylon cercidicola]
MGPRPPKYEHDIVFVHSLHRGSVSDWQDESGMCWPAENLSLDLGHTRILAFGYHQKRINVQSDGAYEGGVVFEPGRALCLAINTARKRDKMSKINILQRVDSSERVYSVPRVLTLVSNCLSFVSFAVSKCLSLVPPSCPRTTSPS